MEGRTFRSYIIFSQISERDSNETVFTERSIFTSENWEILSFQLESKTNAAITTTSDIVLKDLDVIK
jgi:hypothetical protein